MKKILLVLVFMGSIFGLQAQVANQADDLFVCDDNNDGYALFDLTQNDATIYGSQLPSDFTLTYHESLADALAGVNAIVPSPYQNISNPQTIYARLEDNTTGAFDTTNFALIVFFSPEPQLPSPLEVCDDDGDGFTEFNLNDKDLEITNGQPDWIVFYFSTLLDAEYGVFPLSSPYSNVSPFFQTVYARVENINIFCYTIVELDLIVLDGCPFIATVPDDIFINEGDDNGLAIFDLTVNEAQMLGSQDPTVFLFSYHTSMTEAQLDLNAINAPETYQNIANPQTIYVRFYNSTANGYVLSSFSIETDGELGVETEFANSFVIYPNPVSDRLVILSSEVFSELEISILDVNGRLLYAEINASNYETIELNLSTLASGMYWLQLTSEEKSTVRKIVKK